MSIINYAAKVINFKIVYYGPGLAGKTANLQYVHRCLPDENRGNMISLATGDDRTLFFDFLPVSASTVRGFTTKFQLYTVPGQTRYNMTRKLVLRGVDGVVFVASRACATSVRTSASTAWTSPRCPTSSSTTSGTCRRWRRSTISNTRSTAAPGACRRSRQSR